MTTFIKKNTETQCFQSLYLSCCALEMSYFNPISFDFYLRGKARSTDPFSVPNLLMVNVVSEISHKVEIYSGMKS